MSAAPRLMFVATIRFGPYHIAKMRRQQGRSRKPAAGPRLAAALRRGRPRSEEAHQAILDAARDLFIQDGFANLRLEHVAARAGVGKATIYRRWSSKEELALE